MRMSIACAAVLAGALSASLVASDKGVTGDYVEARTAEVYTGGCIMGSEGEVSGKEAVMAWRVSRGSVDGVALDGLSIVAVVAGDQNLGMHELGGAAPSYIKTVVMLDDRATPAQQKSLMTMARSLAPTYMSDVIETISVPLTFSRTGESVRVSAGLASLDVTTDVTHSPACGAAKWFDPLARVNGAKVGLALSNQWSGDGLGAKWKQNDRKSSYVGSFTFK